MASFQPVSLHQPFSLSTYCDVDWAADPDDRHSTSDSAVYLGANLISWWSRKQTVVARSSTKAEYRSLAQTTAKVLWVQTLLTELAVPFSLPVPLSSAKFLEFREKLSVTALHTAQSH